MNDKFHKLFLNILNEASDVDAGPEEFDDSPEATDQSFKGSLDDGTDPESFDVEGYGDESVVEKLREELLGKVKLLEKVSNLLMHPHDQKCLLYKISTIEHIPEYEQLFKPVANAIKKAVEGLNKVISEIEFAATTAIPQRDKRRAEDAEAQTISRAPY